MLITRIMSHLQYQCRRAATIALIACAVSLAYGASIAHPSPSSRARSAFASAACRSFVVAAAEWHSARWSARYAQLALDQPNEDGLEGGPRPIKGWARKRPEGAIDGNISQRRAEPQLAERDGEVARAILDVVTQGSTHRRPAQPVSAPAGARSCRR